MFGSPEVTTGGKALKFYASVRLDVRRVDVITYDAKSYYEEAYDTYYDKYINMGATESTARSNATTMAASKQVEYVFNNCKNVIEFKECCKALGISDATVNEYLRSIEGSSPGTGGSGGGGSGIYRSSGAGRDD